MIQVKASIDDGAASDVRLAKMFVNAGIPVVEYLPVNYMGLAFQKGYEPMNGQELNWIKKHCEIGSHGVTHAYLTRIPLEQAKQEIIDSKAMLESIYDVPIKKFAYPRGYANSDLIQIVKKAGYKEARNTLVGNLYPCEDPLWTSTTVHLGVNRNEYAGKDWFFYAIEMWEKAKELSTENNHIVYEIWCHGWEIDKHDQWQKVKDFIKVIS